MAEGDNIEETNIFATTFPLLIPRGATELSSERRNIELEEVL